MATKKAKPTVKSTPAVKSAKKAPKVAEIVETGPATGDVAHAQELAAEQAVKKGRDTVLVSYTPRALGDLIGLDTEIQVGRKSLKAIRTAQILAQHGE